MFYRFVRWLLLPFFRRRLGVVTGAERMRDGVVLAANHVDYFDGFFVSAAAAAVTHGRIVFLSETKNYWWSGGATIAVDRSDPSACLTAAARAMKRGDSICVFVEGRRNPGRQLLPGKTGAVRLARAAASAIVPVGIVGRSGTSFLDSFRDLFRPGKKVDIHFGEPLRFSWQGDAGDEPHEKTQVVVAAIAPLAQKTIS